MSCRSVNSFDFARKNARAFRYECSFSSAKSNELTDQHDMICFNHASAFYKSKNIVKILMNNKFKALILTGNMPDIYVAMFTITSCGFGQSAHSIESRCVVLRIKGTPIFSAIRGPLVIELLEIYGSLDVQWPTLSHGHSSVRKTSEHSTLDDLFPDNVIKWIFAALLALCVGIHRSPVNSPHKGSIIRTLMMVLWCWSHKMTGQHLRLFSNNSYKLIKLFNSVPEPYIIRKYIPQMPFSSLYWLCLLFIWYANFFRVERSISYSSYTVWIRLFAFNNTCCMLLCSILSGSFSFHMDWLWPQHG